MRRIHLDDFSREGALLILRGTTCHRARNVLRVRPGVKLVGYDAGGSQYEMTVTEVSPTAVVGRVDRVLPPAGESPLLVTLAQAVPRAARMDLVIQKATELGVSRIVPLLAQRSVPRSSPGGMENRARRWDRISAEAVAQCRRSRAPEISAPMRLEEFLEQGGAPLRLLLSPGPGAVTVAALPADSPGAVDVVVGPEGGWSPSEEEACRRAGLLEISLGPRILRTETAGLVVLALLQQRWGDLS